MKLRGSAIVFGNNINTGVVISAKYMSKQGDLKSLIPYMFEAIDPGIHTRLPESILVAGSNFGVGSTREIVPVLLREAGVQAIVARSFSRGFYRNATNLGLPLAEAEVAGTVGGDLLEIDLHKGVVTNLTRSTEVRVIPLPEIMQRILAEGGLVPFFKKYGALT
ncbi:MAG: 3-isopropylmalate dehydratase [Proteobacteria bacterium]|nr:3-isopropylmalate dehydratase [Pseudomonadota bacterium]MBU2228740.1 3-isopropylmalate dehydratase [Pseudomonadota bacterium]